MTAWSNPSHKFATSSQEELPDDFKPGIDLTLGQLIETRTKPIIHWLAPESHVKTNRVGGFRSRFKGRGMDFDESRLYQIGDDIRNIDWRVTARTGEAHTKLFKEERERPVFVVLDQMPSMFFGTAQVFKSLIASKIASQLMWNTLTNGDRFGALLFGETNHFEMKPSSNRRNCMRLLNRIVESYQQVLETTFSAATHKNSGTTTNNSAQADKRAQADKHAQTNIDENNQLSNTLKRLQFLAKPGTLIHVISDFNQFDDDCQRHLSKLSQHADIHCILIKDPIESELPPPGLYGITDGFNKGLLNTKDSSLRDIYHNAFERKQNLVKDFALSHRGVFTCVDTNFEQQSVGLSGPAQQSINRGES
ncbi:DUF58 domain-containing protein [Aliikangiella marina]|uniref:DUF58 domain-containing protein n=1 Tax=Aliikangiella marina TaxID=1712262 RepID=A0A545T2V4_9GAMM|nr:DUF58 domain-containing protein [Aliikangiella marina]TQV71553.1 DUF58 domain-containing protein [Aliikangiella marina]